MIASRRRAAFLALGTLLLGIAGGLVYYVFGSRQTPRGQPPLIYLSEQNLEEVRAAFNDAAEQTRLLALLSPT